MSNGRSTYKYRPLDDPHKQIRLLRLLGNLDLEAQVCCELFHVPLDHEEEYSALSYVWGDPLATKTIIVDGVEVDVTRNLETALRHMRNDDVNINVWADALCINQADILEKSVQVDLMSQIYKNAKYVQAWLGESSEDSETALRFLQNVTLGSNHPDLVGLRNTWATLSVTDRIARIRSLRTNLLKGLDSATGSELEVLDVGMARSTDVPKLAAIVGKKVVVAIRNLLQRPWWYRTWIYQELLLAKLPLFVCGLQIYGGAHVVSGLAIFIADLDDYAAAGFISESMRPEEQYQTRTQIITVQRLVNRKHVLKHEPNFYPVQSLVDLVFAYQYSECFDPRDKVFAMLGMATDDMAVLNPPDYSLTPAEVFERLLNTWTKSRKTLDLLTFRPPRLRPSWRPTFGFSRMPYPMLYYSVEYGTRLYSASLSSVPEYVICDGEGESTRVLDISGFQVDKVLEVGDARRNVISVSDAVIAQWEAMAAQASASPLEFWYSLTAEMSSDGPHLSAEESQQLREDLALWLSSEQRPSEWPRSLEDCVNHARASTSKRFFITEKGRMGLALHVEAADEVCILFGGQAPYLLREAENNMFDLIEDCYISGLMDGEAMEDFKEGKHVTKTFRLC